MLTNEEQSKVDAALAVFESQLNKGSLTSNSHYFLNYMQLRFSFCPTEQFGVILMDKSKRIIDVSTLFYGGIANVLVDLRALAAYVLSSTAYSFSVFHNHPGFGLRPSEEDIKLTQSIVRAFDPFAIKCVDHLVVGHKVYSMASMPEFAYLFDERAGERAQADFLAERTRERDEQEREQFIRENF